MGADGWVLNVPATPAAIDAVHGLLARFLDAHGAGEAACIRFETAAAEVAANLVEHTAAAFTLTLRRDGPLLAAVFEDDGPAFADGPAAAVMPDEWAESGRGLALATALLDELRYERDGPVNRWTLLLGDPGAV